MLLCCLLMSVIISHHPNLCNSLVSLEEMEMLMPLSRLPSQLGMLLLGHWNVIFNGFSGIQLFYKTLKDLRILSWITDCLWECTFLPGCFIFLFLYFCLLLRVLSYFIICSCSLPVCFTAAASIFCTLSQSLPLVCFSHPISWFLFHTFPCLHVSYLL